MSSTVHTPSPSSHRAQVEALADSLCDTARPHGALEMFACERLAVAQWHFERAAILATQFPETSPEALKYQKLALSWEGSFNRALRQLRDLQTLRAQADPSADAPFAKRTPPRKRSAAGASTASAPTPQPQQNQQTAKRTPPPVGRNTPCPCGSGKKFKRCCGTDAPPIINQAA